MTKKAEDKRHAILKRASDNFVLKPPVGIGRKEPIITLPKVVQEQIIDQMRELTGSNGEDPGRGLTFRVKFFGANHAIYKREVLRPRAALRTYCDNVGTPTARKVKGRCTSSYRIMPVAKLIEWTKTIMKLEAAANESFNSFMPDYETHLEAGRAAADHDLPFMVEWNGRTVPVSEVIRDLSPTAEEFRAAFYINIPKPKRLTLTDWSGLSLPADQVDKWAEAELDELEQQMDCAKERLIEDSLKLVKRVNTQLSKPNGRIFDTLISEAAALSESLKGLVEGYDPADLQLRNAAVAIGEKIGAVENTDVWRNSPSAKAEAIRAAKAAEKVLKKSQERVAKKLDGLKPDTGTLIEGGMLGDIL